MFYWRLGIEELITYLTSDRMVDSADTTSKFAFYTLGTPPIYVPSF
jgi:hypothetical protein